MNSSDTKSVIPTTIAKNSRDELNFAEFPIAALGPVPKGKKTLVFEDTIFDPSQGKVVPRKVTISASDKYGLPTPADDEIVLGLIQISSQQGFQNRKVHFTRHELLKVLGWPDNGKNYRRLEESLNRWLGVTLYYDNAWWSREERTWVTEGFHILDSLTLFGRERRNRQRKANAKDSNAGKSSFVWNELVYRSFKAGYLKKLDLEFYRSLKTPASRRLYRFLDKRFYHRKRWEFELKDVACEHVGLSKAFHNSKLKERLLPAITELEEKGFLAPLSKNDRFRKVTHGLWNVVFVKSEARVGKKEIFDESGSSKQGMQILPATLPPTPPSDQELAQQEMVKNYWNALPAAERIELEKEAVSGAAPFLKRQYNDSMGSGGALFKETRKKIIRDHILRLTEKAE